MPSASKFHDDHYVTAYCLAKEGMTDEGIAHAIGVSQSLFHKWVKANPSLRKALERGREPNERILASYIYNKLDVKLQKIWDEIDECESLDNPLERIEAILSKNGKKVRQHLFLFALTQSTFNVSDSLRKLNMSRGMLDRWMKDDPDFAELFEQMNWHKDNFFEAAFTRAVRRGEPGAVIHAAKTKLRNRGYGDKLEIEHSGTITMKDAVPVTALNLAPEVLRLILDALRAHKAANTQTVREKPVDALESRPMPLAESA